MRNHPLEEIKSTSPDNSDTCFAKQNCCQRNPQNMNKIIAGYIFQVGCAKSVKNIHITVVYQKELFYKGMQKPNPT